MKGLHVLWILFLPLSSLADSVVPIDKVENSVNIRLSADASSDIVGELYQGSSIELVSSIDGWHEVQLEGDATGYISADWSRVIADEPVVAEVAEEVVEEAEEAAEEVVTEVAAEALVDTPIVEEIVEDAVESPAEGPVVEEVIEVEIEEVIEADVVQDNVNLGEMKGTRDFLVKFRNATEGGNSQIFDNGNQIGIGTTSPKQRLEVNGSIQIHEQNSSVAGLMITQSSGDTGYIMHNRASTLTIGAGSQDRISIDRDGNVGFGVSRPEHPLQMASGAHVTAGGA